MQVQVKLNLAAKASVLRVLDSNKDTGIAVARTIRAIRRDFKLSEASAAGDRLLAEASSRGPVNAWEVLLNSDDKPQSFDSDDANLRWLRDRLDKGDAAFAAPSALVEIILDLHDCITDALATATKSVN